MAHEFKQTGEDLGHVLGDDLDAVTERVRAEASRRFAEGMDLPVDEGGLLGDAARDYAGGSRLDVGSILPSTLVNCSNTQCRVAMFVPGDTSKCPACYGVGS